MSPQPCVAVCVVTWNSAHDLPACLAAIEALDYRPLEVVVVDCASHDDTVQVAGEVRPRDLPCEVVPLAENRGFAGGMNVALTHTEAAFILSLNADAHPEPSYVSRLLDWTRRTDLRVGAVTGRLIRSSVHEEAPPRLDACGMRLTLTWRHLDRGSGEVDRGQWLYPARVFGATGAASLFRRQALEDVAIDGEVFDGDFHSFREDAELCFRLRERGWEVVYEPSARALHRRFNLPQRRRSMPAAVNYHSLKNRYLLRFYHQTPGNLMWTLLPTALRDLLALGYVVLRERSSLQAYRWLWRERLRIRRRRLEIQSRRTVPSSHLNRWFLRQELPL